MVEDLKTAVATARASKQQADADHERVKELLIQARLEDRGNGPKVLERITDGYLDRDTISRLTSPALAAQRDAAPAA